MCLPDAVTAGRFGRGFIIPLRREGPISGTLLSPPHRQWKRPFRFFYRIGTRDLKVLAHTLC